MFISFLIILGISGITAQVILLRSILITAQGNELAIGIILGIWVISESVGAFSIRNALKDNAWKLLFISNSFFSILFPISLLIPFLSRQIFGLS